MSLSKTNWRGDIPLEQYDQKQDELVDSLPPTDAERLEIELLADIDNVTRRLNKCAFSAEVFSACHDLILEATRYRTSCFWDRVNNGTN